MITANAYLRVKFEIHFILERSTQNIYLMFTIDHSLGLKKAYKTMQVAKKFINTFVSNVEWIISMI